MYSGVTRDTVVVRLTRRMNSSAASTMPTSTATVRSASTVSVNVTSHTDDVGVGVLEDLAESRATRPCSRRPRTGSRPAPAAARTRRKRAPNSRTPSSVSACTMPATGDRAPERMLVAVRASAPVAGKPAKQRRHDVGHALREELGVGIVAIAAHAIGHHRRQQRFDRAEHGHRHRRREQRQRSAQDGTRGSGTRGRPDGMPPNREPIVATSSCSSAAAMVPANSATM